MKFHITENIELVESIRKALKENDGYCPCVYESKGIPKYKCLCESFRERVAVGKPCHCGLYIKDEQ